MKHFFKEQFFIGTGANMAGKKSTILRTVSLQGIVMGQYCLPVCASAAEYSPIKLITQHAHYRIPLQMMMNRISSRTKAV